MLYINYVQRYIALNIVITITVFLSFTTICLLFRNDKKMFAQTEAETKKATIRLLRTIVVLTQTLKSLPDDVIMTMKLLYYEDGNFEYLISS